jgi:hypothetical protein
MKVLPLSFCLALLAGCATSAEWSVSMDRESPDRAVSVTHETEDSTGFYRTRADHLAARQCARKGYGGIVDFAAAQHCVEGAGDGACRRWRVERHYQCTGLTQASPADELASTVRMDPYAVPMR